MKKLMRLLAKLFPGKTSGENAIAVKMFYGITSVKEFFKNLKHLNKKNWPVVPGSYKVINPKGQIAVCTLTSNNLQSFSRGENIAIVGNLYTPNLGIEKIIVNTISNPNIGYFLLCGKDSPVFKAGQAIQCLFNYGITPEKRIRNATGHFPVLRNLSAEKINLFLRQVELIDCIEDTETEQLLQKMSKIDLKKEPYKRATLLKNEHDIPEKEGFIKLKSIGRRIPLDYDEKGFFVITANRDKKEITVKHYYKDNCPGHIITGHSAESILLAILENNLVSQMSHAAYLGMELAKARTAIKLDLNYVQDQPLKK